MTNEHKMKRNFLHTLSVLTVESDEELMKLTINGNNKAFEKLYKKYQGPVLGYLTRVVKKQDLAEEIAQESFFKVYHRRETFDLNKRFKPWMWQIVRNTSIDFLRKKNDLLLNDLFPDYNHEDFTVIENENLEPETRLISKCETDKIFTAIDKLTNNQKEVLMLSCTSLLSNDEIAEVTGQSLSAVKSLLLRARRKLIKLIKDEQLGESNE